MHSLKLNPLAGIRPAVVLALALVATLVLAFVAGAVLHLPEIPIVGLPMFGAVTLAQAALLSQDELQKGVLETFVQEAVLLDRLPLMPIQGNAFAYDEEATLPGVEFRAVNTAYTESTGTVNQKSEKLTILGGDADVDTFIQATRSNVNDQRAIQDQLKIKAAVYKFQDALFNGDTAVDANSFDGLKKRLTGGQVLSAGTNGIPVVGTTSNDRQAFFDFLDALIALVPGLSAGNGILACNRFLRSKVLAALRRENLSTEPIGRLPQPIAQGAAGRPIEQAQLPTYNGIPIVDPGTKPDGSMILPQTETQGTAVDCSSIYAIKFGESEADQAVTGIYNTQGGNVEHTVISVRDLGEQQAKPALRTRIEAFIGLGVFGGQAAARGTGVRNL